MAEIVQTIEIAAAPDDVWAVVGNPGRIGEWVPALADSSAESGIRQCTTQDGSAIVERILEHSDERRYYAYEIAESPLPLHSYHSLIAVQGHDGHSHVTWEAHFQATSPEHEAELLRTFDTIYREGLATLRRRFEAGAAA
jgi:hypothetical protein